MGSVSLASGCCFFRFGFLASFVALILFIYLLIIYLFVQKNVCLFVYLFICLFIHLCIYIFTVFIFIYLYLFIIIYIYIYNLRVGVFALFLGDKEGPLQPKKGNLFGQPLVGMFPLNLTGWASSFAHLSHPNSFLN